MNDGYMDETIRVCSVCKLKQCLLSKFTKLQNFFPGLYWITCKTGDQKIAVYIYMC